MKVLIANTDNSPFYSNGDTHTKEEWIKKLNISSEQFDELLESKRHFDEGETQIESRVLPAMCGLGEHEDRYLITVGRKGLNIKKEEADKIKAKIDEIISEFNK